MIFIPHQLPSMNLFLEQSLTTLILKIHISSIPRFKSCNNSDSLSYILSPLNLNDDQNLIYPDNFLGSADSFVPTSFSLLLSVQTTTSSRLRANISLLTLNWHNPLTTSYNRICFSFCVFHLLSFSICFTAEVIFRSRVIGACLVTTDCIVAMSYCQNNNNNNWKLIDNDFLPAVELLAATLFRII